PGRAGPLDRPRPRLGGALLDHARGSQGRVGGSHAPRLRAAPLDGPAGMGGAPRGAPVDPGFLRRAVFVHRRQHVSDAGAPFPMSVAESRLLLLGWNFRGAEASVRERIAFNADEVREALERIRRDGLATESVIVATCHRSEIYAVSDGERPQEEISGLISRWRGLDPAEVASASFYREGPDAARHLFRVASSLESMALGESEVLGQVRGALALAREAGATRAVSHRMFE